MDSAGLLATLEAQPWEPIIRFLAAGLLGGVIGAERQYADQDAGLRTNILVALGSCLFTLIALFGFATGGNYDASRIISQIVSGIGFLGAGTLFRDNDQVRGLTTAASIWLVAAIGVTVGMGLYLLAIVATLLALAVLMLLRPLSTSLSKAAQKKEGES